MIRLDAAFRFQSQTGALLVLSLPSRFPFAYRLDGVWYEGMYRPTGFARTPVSVKVTRELETFKGWCGETFAHAMPTIVRARMPYWAKCLPTSVLCFCSEKCLDAGVCRL